MARCEAYFLTISRFVVHASTHCLSFTSVPHAFVRPPAGIANPSFLAPPPPDKVYDLLKSQGVPHPENVYASRDGYGGQVLEDLEIVEADDYIQVCEWHGSRETRGFSLLRVVVWLCFLAQTLRLHQARRFREWWGVAVLLLRITSCHWSQERYDSVFCALVVCCFLT